MVNGFSERHQGAGTIFGNRNSDGAVRNGEIQSSNSILHFLVFVLCDFIHYIHV